jgi:hypothetical protein
MKKLTYAEQLKSPLWQRKRLEMLEASGWECTECGTKETTLHVHHRQYIKGKMPWEYENTQLAVLCEDCHSEEHYLAEEMKDLLSEISTLEALALLRGFYVKADWLSPLVGDAGRDRDPKTYAIGFTASLLKSLDFGKLKSVADFAVSLCREDNEESYLLNDNQSIYEEGI